MELPHPLSAKKAVLCTLAYADVFDYPLAVSEAWQFLITKKKTSLPIVQKTLNLMVKQKKLATDGQFYFLSNRDKIVSKRLKREKSSLQKLKIAHQVANWLRLIPSIKLVAVTGALAMNNSTQSDDIDLLIVAAKKRLWLTRLFSVLLVELVAQRRRPGDQMVRNKICLNMFLDEMNLMVPKKEQDLFAAHEVCQLKPIWEKDNCYREFLEANGWVYRFLPNGINIKYQISNTKITNQISKIFFSFLIFVGHFTFFILNFPFFEKLAYRLQLAYMKSRRTIEIIESGRIRFHPQDCREWILNEHNRRICKTEKQEL